MRQVLRRDAIRNRVRVIDRRVLDRALSLDGVPTPEREVASIEHLLGAAGRILVLREVVDHCVLCAGAARRTAPSLIAEHLLMAHFQYIIKLYFGCSLVHNAN